MRALRIAGPGATVLLTAAVLSGAVSPAAAAVPSAPVVTPAPAPQDTAVPPAERAVRDSLRALIDRLARLERGMLRAMEAGDSARLSDTDDRRSASRARLDSLLERVVLGTTWGAPELDRLRDRYPGSRVLELYAARLRLQQGRPAAALQLADRLLGRDAGDAQVHGLRGRALEALGRYDDARLAWLRAFDLDPAAEAPFRALVRLAAREGAAPDAPDRLLEHVRRLRRLAPELAVLRDREIELLQRMGRLEEARAIQDTTGGRS